MHVKVQLLLQGGVDNIYPAFDIAICYWIALFLSVDCADALKGEVNPKI